MNNLAIHRATESLKTCGNFAQLCQTLNQALAPLGFDGFMLDTPDLGQVLQGKMAPFKTTPDGRLRYDWNGAVPKPEWEIRVELVTGLGEKWGQFFVYRRCFDDPILFDIHLLNGEFRRVLAEAIQRGLAHSQSVACEKGSQKTYAIEYLKGAPLSIDAD